MLKLCLGFLVDTLFCVKWLARLSMVSEFVVVVILSEWWFSGQCQPLPTTVGTSLQSVVLLPQTGIFPLMLERPNVKEKSQSGQRDYSK